LELTDYNFSIVRALSPLRWRKHARTIIRIDGISKSFGSFRVLDQLSIDVMPGEKLALIGPSDRAKRRSCVS